MNVRLTYSYNCSSEFFSKKVGIFGRKWELVQKTHESEKISINYIFFLYQTTKIIYISYA